MIIHGLILIPSSETQGQLVGAGKSRNGREKNSGEEKSTTRENPSCPVFVAVSEVDVARGHVKRHLAVLALKTRFKSIPHFEHFAIAQDFSFCWLVTPFRERINFAHKIISILFKISASALFLKYS